MTYLRSISTLRSYDPNRFWSYFNRLTRHSGIPHSLEFNGNTYLDTKKKRSRLTRTLPLFSTLTLRYLVVFPPLLSQAMSYQL